MSLYLDNVFKGKNNGWGYFLTIFIAMFIFIVLSLLFNSITLSSFNTFFEYLLFYIKVSIGIIVGLGLFILLAIKYVHKRDVISIINISNLTEKAQSWMEKVRWNNILKGIIIWGIFLGIQTIILSILYPGAYVFNPETNILFLIVSLLLIISFQSISEEIFFRGYLNQALRVKIKNPLFIILISSLIFGLFHSGSFFYIFSTFLLGVILSLIVLSENGLETAMGIHVINNLIAFSLLPSTSGVASPSTIFMSVNQIPIIFEQSLDIIFKLILLAFVIVYKRKEIKEIFTKNNPNESKTTN